MGINKKLKPGIIMIKEYKGVRNPSRKIDDARNKIVKKFAYLLFTKRIAIKARIKVPKPKDAEMVLHSPLDKNQIISRTLKQYQESPEWAMIVDNRQLIFEDGFKRSKLVN